MAGTEITKIAQSDVVHPLRGLDVFDGLVNRTGWPPGRWDAEPDKVQWTDRDTDLPCLAVRNDLGAWCGYVAVEPGHPFHGVDAESVPAEAHGGLNYADFCQGDVCHVPDPGKPEHVWWFGFDCGHVGDFVPGMAWAADPALLPRWLTVVYRDLDYVAAECVSLARQLVVFATSPG